MLSKNYLLAQLTAIWGSPYVWQCKSIIKKRLCTPEIAMVASLLHMECKKHPRQSFEVYPLVYFPNVIESMGSSYKVIMI